MPEEKYILHLASWYPTRQDAYNGDFVQRTFRALNQHGNHVLLHVTEDQDLRKGLSSYFVERSKQDEVIVYVPQYRGLLRYFHWIRGHYRGLRMIFAERGRPQLIHVHVTLYTAVIAVFLRLIFSIPFVITEHSTIYTEEHHLPHQRRLFVLARILARLASVIMPVSDHLKTSMLKEGIKGHYQVVYNFVADYFYQPLKVRKSKKVTRFLHVSSLDNPSKNISGLLSTFKRLEKEVDNWQLTIVGNENTELVKQWIQDMALDPNRIQVLGPLTHPQVAAEMRRHDVFVLFSNYETFSIVVSEAQASGLPVIATDIGPLRERLPDDHFGLLVPAQDEWSLLKALQAAATGQLTFQPKMIREHAEKSYQKKQVVQDIERIYRLVLNE